MYYVVDRRHRSVKLGGVKPAGTRNPSGTLPSSQDPHCQEDLLEITMVIMITVFVKLPLLLFVNDTNNLHSDESNDDSDDSDYSYEVN